MDANKVDAFIIANSEKFPTARIPIIKDKLLAVDESRYLMITSVGLKDPTTMLLISIFLGSLGVDRFMLGEVGMGILKLLTVGLCGILWIIDMITISDKVKEWNYNEFMKIL